MLGMKKNCAPANEPLGCARVGEVQFTILGSGSSGNASYLEADGTRLLIDCGFSARQIKQRLATIDRIPDRLDGILITHEHSDHVAGLKIIAGKLGIPIYCNRFTGEEIERIHKTKFDFRLFETGQSFDVGSVGVDTFTVPHDATDPVGFLLHTSRGRIGILTDLGHGTRLIADRMRAANVLVLETNHDVNLLRDCPHRPWHLKQRIMSRHGHLSNEGAAKFAEIFMHDGLQHIFCAHLSGECNTPELARADLDTMLQRIGATHTKVTITNQAIPCDTLEFGE
jgi:phosphoribosyl 1,2-cyclic phosphodiesterase